MAKATQASRDVVQARVEKTASNKTTDTRRLQPIYGFSVYNPATGEAYIIEVVDNDLVPPISCRMQPRTRRTIHTMSASFFQHAHLLQHVDHRAVDRTQSVRLSRQTGNEVREPVEQNRRLRSRVHVSARRRRRRFDELYFIPESGDKPPAGDSTFTPTFRMRCAAVAIDPKCRPPSSVAGAIGTPSVC